MPAVGAAVAGIAGAISSLGVVGSALVRVGISFGLSYLARALTPKASTSTAGGFNGKIQAGGAVPRSFIYGRYATGGSLVYANTWGEVDKTPNAYLVQVIALSDLRVKGLAGLIVNGSPVTFDAGASQAGKGYAIPEFNKDGRDHLWIRCHDGSQGAADTYLTGKFSASPSRPWTSAAVGNGVAYAVITALVNDNLFSGVPTFKFVLDGIALYDIRNDGSAGGDGDERWDTPSTWSQAPGNPAVVLYNLLRGIRDAAGNWVYGLQTVGAAQLPLSAWAAAANECDLTVTNADASTAKQYVAGGEIQFASQPGDEMEALLTACNGRLAEVGGIYKPHIGAAGSAVFSFNDADIISTDKQTFTAFPGLDQAVNGVTGTFISPEDGWVEKDLPPRYDADFEAEDGGRRSLANVQYTRVTSNQQGQRLMLSILQEERRARKHGIPMPPSAIAIEPLDFGNFTSARNGYVNKGFRSDRLDISQNLDVVLYLTETDPSAYDYDPAIDELPLAAGSIAIVRPPAQAVRDWAVDGIPIPADGGKTIAGLRLTWGWDADNEVDIDEVQFEVRLASDSSIVLRGSTPFVEAGALDISANIRPSTSYEARARFWSLSGRDFSWSDWLPATTPAGGSVSQSDLDAALDALLRRILAQVSVDLPSIRGDLDTLSGALASQVATVKENLGQVLNAVGSRYGENKALAEIAQSAATTANSALAAIFGDVFATTGSGEAEALFRFAAGSSPDGVAATIAFEARATVQDTFSAAGIYIDAGVTDLGGASRIRLSASEVLVIDPNGVRLPLDLTLLKIGKDVPSVSIVSAKITPDIRDHYKSYQTYVTAAAEVQPPVGLAKGEYWTQFFRQDGTGHAITFKSPDFVTSGIVNTNAGYITKVDFECLNEDPPIIFASDFTAGNVTLSPWAFGAHPTGVSSRTFKPLDYGSVGDLMVAFCFFAGYIAAGGNGNTAANPLPDGVSVPTGWSLAGSMRNSYNISQSGGKKDTTGSICHIIYKRLTAGDNANISPIQDDHAGATQGYFRTEFLTFTGGASPSPIQVNTGFGSGSKSANLVLSTEQNALIVIAGCCGWSPTNSASFTSFTAYDAQYGVNNNSLRTRIGYKIYNTAPSDETIAMNDIGESNNLVACALRI